MWGSHRNRNCCAATFGDRLTRQHWVTRLQIAGNGAEAKHPLVNLFSAGDVSTILKLRGWLDVPPTSAQALWMERAAGLLGPQAATTHDLEELLALVFHYDAAEVLRRVESQTTLAREGAREVIRQLALLLLEGGELDSERFKEIINGLKERVAYRSRELFLPIRLALAGRAGTGELDRVILLVDSAAGAQFSAGVKGSRQRIIEFCAALD